MSYRLLFVLPDTGPGGAQMMTVRLAKHLATRGHDMAFAILFDRGLQSTPLPQTDLPVTYLKAAGVLGKMHLPHRLAHLARRYDLIIGAVEFAATNYGFLAARLAGKPFVSWTHIALDRHEHSARSVDRLISRAIYRRAGWVVFPSHGALESLRRLLPDVSCAGLRVIENFLDPCTCSPHPPDAHIYRNPVILGVGRLAEQKAFDRLIRAHARLRAEGYEQHLVLLGEGPLRPELEAQARRLGVTETVFMPGHVENVSAWMAHACIFALCSRYEGFSLVLLEALSCGTPAVAMDCVAGPREILEGGRYGLLVPEGDEAAFTQALGRLLRRPKERALYSALGRERAGHYAPERIVPIWESLFTEVISAGAR